MSLTKAKKAVSAYFKGKKAAIRLLNNRGIRDKADFFELYVLVLLAKAANGTVKAHTGKNGKPVFYVAGSPSPAWSKASYIIVKSYGARTGLQVQCGLGSVELDVVVIDMAKVAVDDTVPASAAQTAHECKALRGKLKTTHANEMLGKAFRVWGALPLKDLVSGANTARRYSAAAISGSSAGLDAMLDQHGIGLADSLHSLGAQIGKLVTAL